MRKSENGFKKKMLDSLSVTVSDVCDVIEKEEEKKQWGYMLLQ